MSFEDIIEDIFSQRAKKISGHDPWRYGEILAKKTDEIEFNWLVDNLEINQNTTVVDVGCPIAFVVRVIPLVLYVFLTLSMRGPPLKFTV